MGRLLYLPEARKDLGDIWQYVAQESGTAEPADRLVDDIDGACRRHAAQPLLGEPRREFGPTLRCFPIRGYVIFYEPMVDGIKVIQVIHGARDIPAHVRKQLP